MVCVRIELPSRCRVMAVTKPSRQEGDLHDVLCQLPLRLLFLLKRTTPVKRNTTHGSESRPKRATDSRIPSTATNVSHSSTQQVAAQLTQITDALQKQFESQRQQDRLDFQTQLTHITTQQQSQHQQYLQQMALAEQVTNRLRAEVKEAPGRQGESC